MDVKYTDYFELEYGNHVNKEYFEFGALFECADRGVFGRASYMALVSNTSRLKVINWHAGR